MKRKQFLFSVLSALQLSLLLFSCGEKKNVEMDKLKLSVSETVINIPTTVNEQTIKVVSGGDWTIISEDNDWCRVSPLSGSTGDQFTIKVNSNNNPKQRQHTITVSARESVSLVIKQSPRIFSSAIEKDSIALVEIYHATDGAYWEASSDVEWDFSRPVAEWVGVTVSEINGEPRVTALNLFTRKMEGKLPIEIGFLTELVKLDLHGNLLNGTMPDEIGNLTKLKNLNISDNRFDGSIPKSITNLLLLEQLDISKNKLDVFPVEICELEKLVVIHAENNRLTSIPGEITKLSHLEYFYIQDNELTEMPKGLVNMPSLLYLMMGNNRLTTISDDIGNLVGLKYLELKNNKLSGAIPASIAKLVQLTNLDLSNNHLNGTLPDFSNMSLLKNIYLSGGNQLSGTINSFGGLTKLENVNISGMTITGDISAFKKSNKLKTLFLSNNQLSGEIPIEFKNTQLTHLYVENNNLTGNIPAELDDRINAWMSKLANVRLFGNRLKGKLPDVFLQLNFSWANLKPEVNIYPQQETYGFTNIK